MRYVLTYVGLVCILAVAELLMGRLWWCACGEWLFWISDPASSHTSQHLLDPYSFSHVQHGIFFFWLLWVMKRRTVPVSTPRLQSALILEMVWEILENSPYIIERYRTATISLNYFGDSVTNSLGDVLSCAVGFALASRMSWRATLLIYLIFELGMLVTIRDCLSLNVVMLLFPVPAIKAWQSFGGL